ncbi:MAG: SDR family oxidoreductase [Parvibaculum sp.]|nr:SDR family oxidoreductase [Parvibaculum sp.]
MARSILITGIAHFVGGPSARAADEGAAGRQDIVSLRRLGKPEEAAAIVAFLAGPNADFITGQLIPVAGGWATAR